MSTLWAVTLDVRADRPLSDDEVGDLVDMLAEHGAAVAVAGPVLSVTLSAGAANASSALAEAEDVVTERLGKLGVQMAGLDAAEILTAEEQDRRLAEPVLPRLAGVSEVAEMLGVTRQRASALTAHPEAPAPVARLASGPVYVWNSWQRFAEVWPRRAGRPQRVG
jgi:hypothetical protein